MSLLDASTTAAALPYPRLVQAVEALLRDDDVQVPARLVHPLPSGGSLFVMPATDTRLAVVKLITFVPDNPSHGRPAIHGDVIVFDARSGLRRCVLDGPTVTARRTAAVTVAAARRLAACPAGPLLIVGAGVQGRAHLEAFVTALGVQQVSIASRNTQSAAALAAHAAALGARARVVDEPNAALADHPLVVSCTTAHGVVLDASPRRDAFVAAIGAFTPQMIEWAPAVVRAIAADGTIVVDTRDADHEAGDLLQAGVDVAAWPTLGDVIRDTPLWRQQQGKRPVFFKSCGWAGWDLAAARCAVPPLAHAADGRSG
ncbi:delta(1)-pyrroline-2-carboxylate reductase family protein [Tepidimonas charontis]|uniref:Delta(1)-pyrroline-2-carboxylate reductase 1 n=1 Tax=Tepidimonas charontis TaxID=2267262 RepID=A0A554XDL7_9BURK|nr:delta(1)-pyrroline-2-carboxylate reductase family protein [Tepidimonas charontis]TSE33931.1 Delta(1)-pyrroline-2-carboxylate reductase 1 [Tepidimonas charontis]